MNAEKNTTPQICGYYSMTIDRIFEETSSSLKYFKLPKVPLDLNVGLKGIIDKPDSYFEEKMDSILTYITRNKHELVNTNHFEEMAALIPSTKYITYRGVIRMIMLSRYDKKEWCILATKYKGNIYLCQFTKPEKRLAFKNESFGSKKFAYYGPKFEQYCLSDDPYQMPDTSARIDASTQFFCVFKRMLVARKFLFAGEMDGVHSNTRVNLDNPENFGNLQFIELKVTANPNVSPKAEEIFKRFKCPNIWAQSFLTGVNDVYIGFRDYMGIVNEIKYYNLDMLRRNFEEYCNPRRCFEFLNFFLELVEDKMEDVDCPDTVYQFNYDVKTGAINHEVYEGRSQFSLLPQWYLDAVNS